MKINCRILCARIWQCQTLIRQHYCACMSGFTYRKFLSAVLILHEMCLSFWTNIHCVFAEELVLLLFLLSLPFLLFFFSVNDEREFHARFQSLRFYIYISLVYMCLYIGTTTCHLSVEISITSCEKYWWQFEMLSIFNAKSIKNYLGSHLFTFI